MDSIKIKNLKKDSDYRKIVKLFRYSFPLKERIPFGIFVKATKKGYISFTKYMENNLFLGFTIIYNNLRNRHLLYFAVNPENRNSGIGTKILQCVINESDTPFYLLSEYYPQGTPDADLKVRRLNFYKRNGLLVAPIIITEFGVKFFVLSTTKDLDCSDHFNMFKTLLGFFYFLNKRLYRIENN